MQLVPLQLGRAKEAVAGAGKELLAARRAHAAAVDKAEQSIAKVGGCTSLMQLTRSVNVCLCERTKRAKKVPGFNP
jgi:hypothetical protein